MNAFYSIFRNEDSSHEYDMKPLKDTQFRMAGGVYYDDGRSNTLGRESPTTSDDYDNAFVSRIRKLDPPYLVDAFLTYHFNYYVGDILGLSSLFVKHIQFVALPKLQAHAYEPKNPARIEVMKEWVEKMKISLLDEVEQKNSYLLKAHEYVLNNMQSYSTVHTVLVPTFDVATELTIDHMIALQLVTELADEQHIRLGTEMYKNFTITPGGIKYLQNIKQQAMKKKSNLAITTGDYSNIQVQQDVQHSNQNQSMTGLTAEHMHLFLTEIRASLEELTKHLSAQQKEDLEQDIVYLERSVKKDQPDKKLWEVFMKNIVTVLKPVPPAILASIFSDTVLPLVISYLPQV